MLASRLEDDSMSCDVFSPILYYANLAPVSGEDHLEMAQSSQSTGHEHLMLQSFNRWPALNLVLAMQRRRSTIPHMVGGFPSGRRLGIGRYPNRSQVLLGSNGHKCFIYNLNCCRRAVVFMSQLSIYDRFLA